MEIAINAQKLAILEYDRTGQKQRRNSAIAKAILEDGTELAASVLFDPVDWALTARDCVNGACSPIAVAFAVLPVVSGKTGTLLYKGVDKATGQWHHVFSNKIMRALNNHEILSGVFKRNDLLVQASDLPVTEVTKHGTGYMMTIWLNG